MVLGAILLQLFALNALTQLGKACKHECYGSKKLIDLERGYYPRYLTSIDCGTCFPYSCTPRLYGVKVLMKKGNEDIKPDGSLPESLRGAWRFVYKPVVVGCICN